MRRKNSDLGWTYKIHTNLLTGQQEGFKFHREVFGSEVSENLPADRIVQKTDDDQNYSKNFSQSIATKFAIDKMFKKQACLKCSKTGSRKIQKPWVQIRIFPTTFRGLLAGVQQRGWPGKLGFLLPLCFETLKFQGFGIQNSEASVTHKLSVECWG